jgi:hypothetical protein
MAAAPTLRKIAVVLFDGFTVLDVYGPMQASLNFSQFVGA